jgi:hypothetical protein
MLAIVKANIKHAVRENIVPGFILQVFALSIVLTYFFFAPAIPVFEYIAQLKQKYSTGFGIVATAVFGGLLPFLLLWQKKKIAKPIWQHLLFNILFWAFMGWLIDSFYQLQVFLFGSENDVTTIIKKVLLDQFVFSVFITSPFVCAMFIWRESNFGWQRTLSVIKLSYLNEKLPATILSTWIVWLPSVTLIYAMPTNLQLPLFNLVLFFFVLILSALNRD